MTDETFPEFEDDNITSFFKESHVMKIIIIIIIILVCLLIILIFCKIHKESNRLYIDLGKVVSIPSVSTSTAVVISDTGISYVITGNIYKIKTGMRICQTTERDIDYISIKEKCMDDSISITT